MKLRLPNLVFVAGANGLLRETLCLRTWAFWRMCHQLWDRIREWTNLRAWDLPFLRDWATDHLLNYVPHEDKRESAPKFAIEVHRNSMNEKVNIVRYEIDHHCYYILLTKYLKNFVKLTCQCWLHGSFAENYISNSWIWSDHDQLSEVKISCRIYRYWRWFHAFYLRFLPEWITAQAE